MASEENRRVKAPPSLKSSVPWSIWNIIESERFVLDDLYEVVFQCRHHQSFTTEYDSIPFFPNKMARNPKRKLSQTVEKILSGKEFHHPREVIRQGNFLTSYLLKFFKIDHVPIGITCRNFELTCQNHVLAFQIHMSEFQTCVSVTCRSIQLDTKTVEKCQCFLGGKNRSAKIFVRRLLEY